ncbi:MAG: hypothetical protein N3F65_01910 [Nitrososphaeria archaeon]|nr:hypothetical protein [Nitrososphaeria archaeon]MDW8021117.1 SIS domain-containing protein [Nitrososphaerota archaeon]
MEYFMEGIEIGKSVNLKVESIKKAIFIGVGGSGIVGDVAAEMLSSKGIETKTLKSYNLPKGDWDLAIAISHSGNTIETIKPVLELIDQNTPCVFITSGGILGEVAAKKRIPIAEVKRGIPPRYCFSNMLGALLGIFEEIGAIRIEVNVEDLKRFQKRVMRENPTNLNPAKQAAIKIADLNPLIYVCERTKSVGYRLKCQLNENAKMHCGFGEVPEVLHNDIEAIGCNDLIILPRISEEDYEVKEVMDALISFFDDRCLCLRADSKGGLSELLELFMLVDYISLYVSVLKDADPINIPRIIELRKRNRLSEEILKRVRAIFL